MDDLDSALHEVEEKRQLADDDNDEDEDPLPRENFLQMELENGFSISVRPSGTEPKIKYYLFGSGERNAQDLSSSKEEVCQKVEEIASWLVEDAHGRVG